MLLAMMSSMITVTFQSYSLKGDRDHGGEPSGAVMKLVSGGP